MSCSSDAHVVDLSSSCSSFRAASSFCSPSIVVSSPTSRSFISLTCERRRRSSSASLFMDISCLRFSCFFLFSSSLRSLSACCILNFSFSFSKRCRSSWNSRSLRSSSALAARSASEGPCVRGAGGGPSGSFRLGDRATRGDTVEGGGGAVEGGAGGVVGGGHWDAKRWPDCLLSCLPVGMDSLDTPVRSKPVSDVDERTTFDVLPLGFQVAG
mmetsp:Transcript_27969/g.70188  ORF Transcript_27969/g.70188 Transcript_27969/m.70188 type:complete len:213 (-) Transcript_27969:1275-1913(-)